MGSATQVDERNPNSKARYGSAPVKTTQTGATTMCWLPPRLQRVDTWVRQVLSSPENHDRSTSSTRRSWNTRVVSWRNSRRTSFSCVMCAVDADKIPWPTERRDER